MKRKRSGSAPSVATGAHAGSARAAGFLLLIGLPALDDALGGGLPRGHMVEIFGPSGCGKTTLALQCVAHAQKNGLTAAWIDAEHTFDPAYADALGVDVERVPVRSRHPPNRAWKSRARWSAPALSICWWWIRRRRWFRASNWKPASANARPACTAACWHRVCASCVARCARPAPASCFSIRCAPGPRPRRRGETTRRRSAAETLRRRAYRADPVQPEAAWRSGCGKIRSPESVTDRALERRRGVGFVESP